MTMTLYLVVLLALDAACLLLTVVGMPGNWLMVGLTAGFAWWQWDARPLGWWPLVIIAVLAGLGEVLEFAAGAVGTRVSGGSRASAIWALVGGLLGGILGLFVPPPVIGSILGACIGAAIGAAVSEHDSTGDVKRSLRAGAGAGTGRLLGTVAKVLVGLVIWGVILVAAIWP